MLRIARVGALDGGRLDIELTNGSLILLNLDSLLGDPSFAALLEDDRILYPKTDGDRVYWQNGPSIPVARLLELVGKP